MSFVNEILPPQPLTAPEGSTIYESKLHHGQIGLLCECGWASGPVSPKLFEIAVNDYRAHRRGEGLHPHPTEPV
jgi:hypothetical protein